MKKVLFIIDNIELLNWKRDNSILFADNAQFFGNKIYFCYAEDIFLNQNMPFCYATQFSIQNRLEKKYTLVDKSSLFNMNDFQMILIRLEPPVDSNYLTMIHILNFVNQSSTFIMNNPSVFQTSSEKFISLNFTEFIPKTLITSRFDIMKEFLQEHGKIVLKPLYGFGSADVFLINQGDYNFKLIFEILLRKYQNCPMIGQKFIEGVRQGDKRVITLDGHVIGSFLRIPKEDSILSGTVHGSAVSLSPLTERELCIVEAVKGLMKKNGIYFAGIDIIDGYLTEVNFTSPTGLAILMELTGLDYGASTWKMIEDVYKKEIEG